MHCFEMEAAGIMNNLPCLVIRESVTIVIHTITSNGKDMQLLLQQLMPSYFYHLPLSPTPRKLRQRNRVSRYYRSIGIRSP